jgi:hypothetical protein
VNTSPDPLDQLFRAARLASSPQPDAAPPFGLETRVLAAWRSSRGTAIWDTGVLVRGLAVAVLLVLASSWPAFEKQTNSDSENLQFADSSVQSDYSQ